MTFTRLLRVLKNKSLFLLGPRGTGKSTWIQEQLKPDVIIDLLDHSVFLQLSSDPTRLRTMIPPKGQGPVVIDEIQRVPELLNEVHRLIEKEKRVFYMTGSSARKLRKSGVNLLAGRALQYKMHPLTARELGDRFNLKESLQFGHLPAVYSEPDRAKYLASYVGTYLREEVQQEGLTRNIPAFSRFLEAVSFSQASVLNLSTVAQDVGVDRKVIQNYIEILEDLLIAFRIPIFTKKAKRKLISHPKFFYFDAGIFKTLRPRGPLEAENESTLGASLKTLVLQELIAINDGLDLGFQIYYWRTDKKLEVDFVLYGERGVFAIEVKSSDRIRPDDLNGLNEFLKDYPMAKGFLLYAGTRKQYFGKVLALPIEEFFRGKIEDLLSN